MARRHASVPAIVAAFVIVGIAIASAMVGQRIGLLHGLPFGSVGSPTGAVPTILPPQQAKADVRLTRESIELLLNALDEAKRRKDADGILRHLAPEATITIHIRQGAQQQMTTLTREEYRTTLNMGFAFPSANDYARVGTTITLAPDERSAKVSVKSTETLRHERRELKVEGEETVIVRMRGDTPMIISLEQVVPGDST